ncbi:MAG TPA: HEAT repeat domain-containing protein, partial [Gemmataceae bacterium]|nr:HEAT repeat domain-containing protein [Gemmataceae bacterium]
MQPLVVMAQQPFQLKRPKECDKEWSWVEDIPPHVVFDPLSTVSATYGVAYQTKFRDNENVWSSRPTIFVIDQSGVLRHVASTGRNQDIREEGIFPILDELDAQRKLISALEGKDAERREAVGLVLAPRGPRTGEAIPALVKSLTDEDTRLRSGAAAALLWLGSRAEEAVPALTVALEDNDARVRRFATMALGRVGASAKTAVPRLVRGLTDEDQRVRME